METRLYAIKSMTPDISWGTGRLPPATQAEIDAAAGVTELRAEMKELTRQWEIARVVANRMEEVVKQRDALLAAAKGMSGFSPFWHRNRTYGCDYCDSEARYPAELVHEDDCPWVAAKKAIALCEPKQVTE